MSIEASKAVILEYKVKNTNSVRELYLNSTAAHDAEKRIKLLYGEDLLWSNRQSGTSAERMYEELYGKNKSNDTSSNEKGSPVFLLIVIVIIVLWIYFK